MSCSDKRKIKGKKKEKQRENMQKEFSVWIIGAETEGKLDEGWR